MNDSVKEQLIQGVECIDPCRICGIGYDRCKHEILTDCMIWVTTNDAVKAIVNEIKNFEPEE